MPRVYEEWSGRSFKSTPERLNTALLMANNHIAAEGQITVNDFYDQLELSVTEAGAKNGWNAPVVTLRFSVMLDDNMKPVISYWFQPPPVPLSDLPR